MCGICGIVTRRSPPIPDLNVLTDMLTRIAHRGPDGSGYYRDRWAALGHTRLAIVDPAGGAQPLSNEAGDLWLSCNGEIFNWVELAAELKALGHVFKTNCDSEVVLHAWEQWGHGCFDRFNGQWALALWDARRRVLVLSRDRLGIRPLHYTRVQHRLLFASEVKSLFADAAVTRALDPAGLAQLFTFWGPVAPTTLFSGIKEVSPGHILEYDAATGSLRETAYWKLSFAAQSGRCSADLGESRARLRDQLENAAHLRFSRSDVPVGAYLSGGLDSSIIAALVARETAAPLETFSLRFDEAEFDEGPYQREMARRLGTHHHEVLVSCADIAAVFPAVIRHAERPLLRAAPAPLFLLSQLVRQHGFKVVVTGEGADEVLGGYDLFRELKVRLFLARDPSSQRRAEILRQLYPWMQRNPSHAPAFARVFFQKSLDRADPALSHRPRWDTTRSLNSLLSPELRSAVEAHTPDAELIARMPQEHTDWDPLSVAQWLEYTTLLPGYILSAQGDRMLMAHSVEGRFPFLDANLVEFANSLPAQHKILGLEEKHILKSACADLVPEMICRRPKQPYRAPDAASFFAQGSPDWLDELTSDRNLRSAGIFRPEAVKTLLSKCRAAAGRAMSNGDNMRIVAVLSTLLFQRSFIEHDGAEDAAAEPPRPMKVVDRVKEAAGVGT